MNFDFPCEPLSFFPDIFPNIQIGDPEAVEDIFEYEHFVYREMRLIEERGKVIQPKIPLSERRELIDWMSAVHFNSCATTNGLYVAIGIVDRLFTEVSFSKEKLHFIGGVALMIASKFEEVVPMNAHSLTEYISDPVDEIVKSEKEILNLIDYDLSFPTPLFFLTIFLQLIGKDQKKILFSRYVLEVCVASEEFIGTYPSLLASIAIWMTMSVFGVKPWNAILEKYTSYQEEDLWPHVHVAHSLLLRRDCSRICQKYSLKIFHKVGLIPIGETL